MKATGVVRAISLLLFSGMEVDQLVAYGNRLVKWRLNSETDHHNVTRKMSKAFEWQGCVGGKLVK